jgi:hypothetical protein
MGSLFAYTVGTPCVASEYARVIRVQLIWSWTSHKEGHALKIASALNCEKWPFEVITSYKCDIFFLFRGTYRTHSYASGLRLESNNVQRDFWTFLRNLIRENWLWFVWDYKRLQRSWYFLVCIRVGWLIRVKLNIPGHQARMHVLQNPFNE